MNQQPAESNSHSRRLSAAGLWQQQTDFYESVGIDAWRGSVPSRITTNSHIARVYARCVAAYMADTQAEEIVIVEAGAGHGRFAFLCIQHLQEMQEAGLLPATRWTYVLTDIAERNLEFWQQHEGLQPMFAAGVADLAHYRAGDEQLTLRRSGRVLSPGQPTEHVVMIGNYFFDSLPIDVFLTEGDRLRDCFPVIDTTEAAKNGWQWEHADIAGTAYHEPELEELTQYFHRCVPHGCFTIPVQGIRGLAAMRRWASGGLMVLSADKGYLQTDEFQGRPLPTPVPHGGCYSMSVNFAAIARWFENRQGTALLPQHQAAGLHVTAFAEATGTKLQHLTREYATSVSAFSPGDYHQLSRRPQEQELDLPRCLSLIRLSGHDAILFYQMRKHVRRGLENARPSDQRALISALRLIAHRYFHWGSDDIPFTLAHLLEKLSAHADAIRLYERSLQLFGDHPTTYCNLARCQLSLGQQMEATRSVTAALKLKPDSTTAARLLQRIEQGDQPPTVATFCGGTPRTATIADTRPV